MGTTNRSTVRVLNFHGDENERIDQDHFDTLASIAADAKRRLQRFIGERRLSPVDVGGVPTTDNAAVMGSVIAVGDAAFTIDGVDLVLSASETTPLEFLIASSIGGSGTAAAGDIMQFGGTDTVAFTLPTAGHPRMILARVVDALTEDPDSGWVRRKWRDDTVNPPAEVEESGWLGIQERVIEWIDTDNSLADADPNSTWSKMALGYQKVAFVTLTAPATLSTSWQRLLPAVTDVTRLPGGELASIAQALSAIVFQIEAIIGAGWDTAPATTILATAFKDTAQDITLGLHAARLAALEGRTDVLEDQGFGAIVIVDPSTITIAPATITAVIFADPDEYDPKGWHDPAGAHPERVTVSATGLYQLSADIEVTPASTPATGIGSLVFTKNGAGGGPGADWGTMVDVVDAKVFSGSRAIYLTAGDYVGIAFSHTCKDGGGVDINCTLTLGSLSVVKVR
jgi:hypothetical protein